MLLSYYVLLLSLFSLSHFPFAGIELVLYTLGDLLEQMLWEQTEAVPSHIQTLEYVSVLVSSLREAAVLELVQEFEVQVIFVTESLLTNDGLQRPDIDRCGIVSVQLIRHVGMVNPSHALSDTALH